MGAGTCWMDFPGDRRIWMFGRRIWPGGLILSPFFILIVRKRSWLKGCWKGASRVAGLMIIRRLLPNGLKFLMTIPNLSLIITQSLTKFVESIQIDP
jgi:hypothetical protein